MMGVEIKVYIISPQIEGESKDTTEDWEIWDTDKI